jgi:hypothetical protein
MGGAHSNFLTHNSNLNPLWIEEDAILTLKYKISYEYIENNSYGT